MVGWGVPESSLRAHARVGQHVEHCTYKAEALYYLGVRGGFKNESSLNAVFNQDSNPLTGN